MVNLQPGKQFRVVLEGIDCSTVPQSELEPLDLSKRLDANETVTLGSSVNGELISEFILYANFPISRDVVKRNNVWKLDLKRGSWCLYGPSARSPSRNVSQTVFLGVNVS
jgi:hypothetical protein